MSPGARMPGGITGFTATFAGSGSTRTTDSGACARIVSRNLTGPLTGYTNSPGTDGRKGRRTMDEATMAEIEEMMADGRGYAECDNCGEGFTVEPDHGFLMPFVYLYVGAACMAPGVRVRGVPVDHVYAVVVGDG